MALWIRGLTYFRLFDNTRYLSMLIIEVVKDMKGFLVLLIYAIFAFSFFYHASGLESSYGLNFLAAVTHSLGDWNLDNVNDIQWVVFALTVIINLTVMFNLLIAVISYTFDKVQNDFATTDTLGKPDLILEAELLLVHNRTKSCMQYIQRCVVNTGQESEVSWEGRVQVLSKQLAKVGEKFEVEQKKNEKQSQEMIDQITELKEMQNQRHSELKEVQDQRCPRLEEVQNLILQQLKELKNLKNEGK